jgi:uncharacterized membrane protein YphA (DoxX/SURF4 family)
MEIGGVDTYVHWSVFVAIAFILAGVASRPVLAILGLTCYLGIFLIHETGHALVARRRGYSGLRSSSGHGPNSTIV